jgi:hypothetical protein
VNVELYGLNSVSELSPMDLMKRKEEERERKKQFLEEKRARGRARSNEGLEQSDFYKV